jgi:hypothetical protein
MTIRRISKASTASLILLGGMAIGFGIPNPAYAAVSCTHQIEWYTSRYEVSVGDVWRCTGNVYAIRPIIAITKPRYAEGSDTTHLGVSSASSWATLANASGSQQYCASSLGTVWYTHGSFPVGGHTPPKKTSCINA